MLKLMICLLVGVATSVCLVQLRQQRLEYGHEASQLHAALAARQGTLWNQQVEIAARTTPGAVRRAVAAAALKLEPAKPAGTLAVWTGGGVPQ